MAELLDILPVVTALSIPFMLGIVAGVEIVKRRPKTTATMFGEILVHQLHAVHERRMFVGLGPQISSTVTVEVGKGRKLEIEIRETA